MDVLETVKTVWREILFEDVLALERYKVGIHPTIDTACWNWAFKPAPGEHKIFVGAESDRLAYSGKAETFIKALLYHEISHSLWTEKDIEGTSRWCLENKVPFVLYNLFEDARIEEKFRTTFKKKFGWATCMKTQDDLERPESVLYRFKHREDVNADIRSLLCDFERIRTYYKRIIVCETSEALRPILLEWSKEFPPVSKQKGSKGDILTAEQAEKMESESKNIFEAPESNEPREEGFPLSEYSAGRIFHDDCGYAADDYKKYLPLLVKLFQDRSGYLATESSSKRLNTRGLVGTTEKLYRRKAVMKSTRKKVNLIVDCSGSMGGTPIANARAFALVLNALSKLGKIEGHLILTQVKRGEGVTETVKFPLPESKILSIPANGEGENISGTIELTKSLLKKADFNFFFTDGDISDTPVNKKKLSMEGVYTFGLYVGIKTVDLDRWFDRTIVKESLSDLINELLRRIN